jgi:hypothetical protein
MNTPAIRCQACSGIRICDMVSIENDILIYINKIEQMWRRFTKVVNGAKDWERQSKHWTNGPVLSSEYAEYLQWGCSPV